MKFRENIEKHAIYEFMSEVTGKKLKTIKQYFWRNGLSPKNKEHILTYIGYERISSEPDGGLNG